MIRRIVRLGEPSLRAPAREVGAEELFGEPVLSLARDMAETLAHAGGVGLAAPQVGESLRMILAGSFPTEANPDRPLVPTALLINPRVVSASSETETGWEGCLSFPHYRVRVARRVALTVEYLAPDGTPSRVEASGFYARVLQHEIDHLDGILTLDHTAAPDDVQAAGS